MVRMHVGDLGNVEPLLLTPAQAAKALGISRTSLYPLLLDGTITSVKIGRSRRIPRAALEEYVKWLGAKGNEAA